MPDATGLRIEGLTKTSSKGVQALRGIDLQGDGGLYGAGLETQFQRCHHRAVNWLCLDVPEAIDARERFFAPSERCRHLRGSALALSRLDEVDDTRGVFVTAEGLFMYFEEREVRQLVTTIVTKVFGCLAKLRNVPPAIVRVQTRGRA